MSLVMCHGRGDSGTINLIHNGSFVGHADHWFPFASQPGTVAFAAGPSVSPGSGALSVVAAAGSAAATYAPGGQQVIPLGSAAALHLQGMAQSANAAAGARMRIAFYATKFADGFLGTEETPVASLASGDWTEVSADVARPEGAQFAIVRLRADNMDGTPVYWDDLYVGGGSGSPPYGPVAAPPFLTDRILNGDFGDAFAFGCGWEDAYGALSIGRDTDTPIAGGASLTVVVDGTDTDEGIVGLNYGVLVRPGEPLRFGFTIRYDVALRCLARWLLLSADGQTQSAVWASAGGAGTETVALDLTAPADAAELAVFFVTTATGASPRTFTIDDVSLGTP